MSPKEKKPRNYKFIAVSPETHTRLLELGKMNDTMDSVINKLLSSKTVGQSDT